jgi:mRNA-degrading endonuclease RelE of RelBE toxin-antitoxin system
LLPINPMLLDIVKMKGYENTYRIRIGKYRVIIVVDFVKRLIKVVKLDVRGRIGY